MDAHELIQSFAEFAKQKNIDRPTMIRILEDVFKNMIRKRYGSDENFDVIINADKGDLEIYRFREIVDDDSEDIWDFDKVSLTEAKKIEPDFEIGEEVSEQVFIEDFGRRAVTTARQTLIQKVKDLEKDILFQKYKDLVGEIITGEVYQLLSKEVLLTDGEGNEIAVPRGEQIQKDRYRKGENVRAIVHKVEMVNGNPKIILSRTSPVFLERLFEQEVPEVYDGLITIKKVVREPGERAKVAVESYDDRIDPVGACVGMKGSRIHAIVRELQNENIDVINYTENLELYIQRALALLRSRPSRLIKTMVGYRFIWNLIRYRWQSEKVVWISSLQVVWWAMKSMSSVNLPKDRLKKMWILSEFSDEIEAWVIDELNRIGLDTAKSVLALSKDELVRRTDLEEETVDSVLNILKKEFE